MAKRLPDEVSQLLNRRDTQNIVLGGDVGSKQKQGQLLVLYNTGNLTPQDLSDPVTGETYAIWTQFVY